MAYYLFQNNKQLGVWCSTCVSSDTLGPHFVLEKCSF